MSSFLQIKLFFSRLYRGGWGERWAAIHHGCFGQQKRWGCLRLLALRDLFTPPPQMSNNRCWLGRVNRRTMCCVITRGLTRPLFRAALCIPVVMCNSWSSLQPTRSQLENLPHSWWSSDHISATIFAFTARGVQSHPSPPPTHTHIDRRISGTFEVALPKKQGFIELGCHQNK